MTKDSWPVWCRLCRVFRDFDTQAKRDRFVAEHRKATGHIHSIKLYGPDTKVGDLG